MTLAPGTVSLIHELIQAGAITTTITIVGAGVGYLVKRRHSRRDAIEAQDREVEREKRRYFDERARSEIERLEAERTTARTEAQTAEERVLELLREVAELRVGWVGCFLEAEQMRRLICTLYAAPPAAGSRPPDLPPGPDPRRRPDIS